MLRFSPSSVPEALLALTEKLHGRAIDQESVHIIGDLKLLESDEEGDAPYDTLSIRISDKDGEMETTGYRVFFAEQCNMLLVQ